MPLGEIVIDFYDKLKSISKGYASFDYHLHDFRPSKLAKLDILLNGEPVDALSTLTHVDNSVTFKEQKMPMREGKWYLVYVRLDHVTGRIMASARIEKFLNNTPIDYEQNQEVQLLVADETDLGYKVIINNQHWGLIYYNEVFQRLEKGEHLKGYIKEVREDDKIDVSLTPQGYQKVEGIAGVILEAMKTQGGYIPVHDKSDPDVIYSLFRCSKKAFKQAIGALYKQHLITLEDGGIRLVNEK